MGEALITRRGGGGGLVEETIANPGNSSGYTNIMKVKAKGLQFFAACDAKYPTQGNWCEILLKDGAPISSLTSIASRKVRVDHSGGYIRISPSNCGSELLIVYSE